MPDVEPPRTPTPLMKLSKPFLRSIAAAGLAVSLLALRSLAAEPPPNIIYILADDMGRGDLSVYNPAAAWKTPHLDRLAQGGMLFTDAHSSSAVCTPSRYSIMTGRYAWRSRLKQQVGYGYSLPFIEPNRLTVAALLQQHGYRTAMVGKWHLGLEWAHKDGGPGPDALDPNDGEAGQQGAAAKPAENSPKLSRWIDYTQPFRRGPVDVGFQSFIGISASLDMAPYVWLRNDRVETVPARQIAGSKAPAMWRAGPVSEDFTHVGVQPRLAREAVDFLEHQDGKQPFFLYLALASPHTPIVPSPEFSGRTGTTPYGDFCVEVDATVGAILRALEARGMDKNTLIIFAADNGASPAADFPGLKAVHHDPQPGLRGAKADLYEGGHRVPFIARWPAKIAAGSRSDALVCQIDFLATCAQLLATPLPANTAEDSVSLLPILTGTAPQVRESLVNHSVNGSFAIRRGPWKLCLAPDSGGWSDPKPGQAAAGSPPFQLFNLEQDPAEKTNLYAQHPEIVQQLGELLKQQVLNGRSTPGAPQQNTGGNDWPHVAWMKQFK
jgi:arylsulfatase A